MIIFSLILLIIFVFGFFMYLFLKFSALISIGEIARFSFVNPYYFVHIQLAIQEEKLRIEEETLYAAQREAARAAKQKKLLEVRGENPKVYVSEPLLMYLSLSCTCF